MLAKTLPVVFTFCLLHLCGHAQKGALRGVLKDSATKQTLSLASVTVFTAKDTSVITYRLSDPLGAFHIPGLPLNLLCRVVISFQGYRVYRKEFTVSKETPELNLGTVYMADDPKALDEILVTAERPPMQVRNDTLEFNASAFKTLPSAMVEDLLKKLPGVDVDLEGNITVRGRKVNRLLVDGKEFFGGDHKIATRNLPSNIVDKVQVTDDKEELDANPLLTKDEVGQVLNIKLKRAIKQGWFGKAYASGGTNDRHEAGAIVNLFRDTAQLSVLGYSNNVNKPGFTMGDLRNIGGFDRGGIGSMSVNSNGGISINGTSFGGGEQGIQTSRGGGFNFNNQLGKTLTLNFQYFYGQVASRYESLSNYQKFLEDTVLTSPSQSSRQNRNRNHQFGGSANWKIDSVTTLAFRPGLSLGSNDADGYNVSSTTDNFKGLVNRNAGNNFSGGRNRSYNHSLYFNKMSRKKRGRSFTLSSNLGINENDYDNYNEGVYTFYKGGTGTDSLLNQLQDRGNENVRSGISANFTEPLSKKISLTLSHRADYSAQENRLDFYNREPVSGKYTVYSDAFSTGVRQNSWQNTASANLSFRIKKWSVSPAVNFQWVDNKARFTKNPPVNRHYFFTYPSLNLNWNGWRLGYSVYINLPQASDLQQVIDISNPLYKQYGNPDLKPAYNRSVNLSYFKFFQKSGSSFNFSVNGSFQNDAVLRQTFLDSNRVQISRPVNINGTANYYAYFFYNHQYKFNKDLRLSLRPNINGGYNKNFVSVNGTVSEAFYTRLSAFLGLMLNYKDKIEWNQQYGLMVNRSRYADAKAFRNAEVITHSAESEVILRWPAHVVWESIVNYIYNPQVSPGIRKSTVRWNSGVNYLFLKEDKGQLRLSVFDLLNQNTAVFRYTSESGIYDSQTSTLQRYFLLSFIYNLRAFGSGKKVGGKDRTFGFW